MPRKPKPKPSARDWRVQPLMSGRDEIAALADLRRLTCAVQAGGEPVAATIQHWELTDIGDHLLTKTALNESLASLLKQGFETRLQWR